MKQMRLDGTVEANEYTNLIEHDKIIKGLTDEKLADLLIEYTPPLNCWSAYHWVLKPIIEWNENEKERANGILQKEKSIKDFNELQKIYINDYHQLRTVLNQKIPFTIEREYEHPLKDGKYFIDLIITLRPIEIGQFSTWQNNTHLQFVIEVKTKKDMASFSQIIRQIKKYKNEYQQGEIKTLFYCLLSPKIDNLTKKIFENEGIICLELK